jgi:hypothetical protein
MGFPIEETLTAMGREMRPLLETVMEGVLTKARGVLEEAEQRRAEGLAEVAEERAKGFAELDAEHTASLAEVDGRRAELQREIAAMHKHKEAQEGHVALNIGGYRFEASVQTLRRLPHTFFDAYFSGRYAHDVFADGSIFVDRDGEHFRHVLQYMRDGVVAVAEPCTYASVSLLRLLKREFGFYCIELNAKPEPEQPGKVYVMGGMNTRNYENVTSMEQYGFTTGQWSALADMGTEIADFAVCVVAGEVYVVGGNISEDLHDDEIDDEDFLSSEKYTLE